ncbi:MAG TPA: hypothetical protein GX532_00675 [Clostridia bacterium]|nr:hypothetical protein [Clostridia bacterium]
MSQFFPDLFPQVEPLQEVKLIQAPLLQENDYIRHDSFKLATLILNLCSGKKAMGW